MVIPTRARIGVVYHPEILVHFKPQTRFARVIFKKLTAKNRRETDKHIEVFMELLPRLEKKDEIKKEEEFQKSDIFSIYYCTVWIMMSGSLGSMILI